MKVMEELNHRWLQTSQWEEGLGNGRVEKEDYNKLLWTEVGAPLSVKRGFIYYMSHGHIFNETDFRYKTIG